jgi:solute carrier family 25 folate transporter 32
MPQRIETVQSSQTFEHAADMSTSNTQTPKGYLPQHNIAERLLMKIPQSYIVTVSGGLAGAASGIVSCPLDVIKTKLQAQGGFRLRQARESPSSIAAAETYRGVKGTAQMIWREEGIRGMYRGLGPMLLGYVPTWAVYLTVYNSTQRYFNTKTGNS